MIQMGVQVYKYIYIFLLHYNYVCVFIYIYIYLPIRLGTKQKSLHIKYFLPGEGTSLGPKGTRGVVAAKLLTTELDLGMTGGQLPGIPKEKVGVFSSKMVDSRY